MVCLQADISCLALRARSRVSRAPSCIALAPHIRLFCRLATLCRFSALLAYFLQHLQIFSSTCRFSAILCGFSAIPADFLQHSAEFLQHSAGFLQQPADFLQHSADSLQYLQIFCRASSDDINSCTAQRSSVVLFPWWLIVLSAR